MGYLRGCPTELKNDYEWAEVGDAHPIRRTPSTTETRVKDKREGHNHTQSS